MTLRKRSLISCCRNLRHSYSDVAAQQHWQGLIVFDTPYVTGMIYTQLVSLGLIPRTPTTVNQRCIMTMTVTGVLSQARYPLPVSYWLCLDSAPITITRCQGASSGNFSACQQAECHSSKGVDSHLQYLGDLQRRNKQGLTVSCGATNVHCCHRIIN